MTDSRETPIQRRDRIRHARNQQRLRDEAIQAENDRKALDKHLAEAAEEERVREAARHAARPPWWRRDWDKIRPQLLTFEPHVRAVGGRWGFKHEEIYRFDASGRVIPLWSGAGGRNQTEALPGRRPTPAGRLDAKVGDPLREHSRAMAAS